MSKLTATAVAALLALGLVAATSTAADARDSQWGGRTGHHHHAVARDSQWGG